MASADVPRVDGGSEEGKRLIRALGIGDFVSEFWQFKVILCAQANTGVYQ